MPGRRGDLASLRSRLDATFGRISALGTVDLEIRSDFAKYLCVLVSGYAEAAVCEIALDHSRRRSAPTVIGYVGGELWRFQNAKPQKLAELVGRFNPGWREDLERFLAGERHDALAAVVDLKNKIAHGDTVTITLARVTAYYKSVKEIVDFLEQLFD